MSDKELLELAAKAMGKTAWWSPSLEDWQKDLTPPYVDGVVWDPQNDDGDALRLAVTLHMSLEKVVSSRGSAWIADHRAEEVVGTDSLVACRRAIVKAAAAIGETLP